MSEIKEGLVVRFGDHLVVSVRGDLSQEFVSRLSHELRQRIPGAEVTVIAGVEQP